jgi:hypothetical protein
MRHLLLLSLLLTGCSALENLLGGDTKSEVDLQNPYRETGIPVRALCSADEVDEGCRPRTRKAWQRASQAGFQPLQLAAGKTALAFPFGPTITVPLTGTQQSFEQVIDHYLFRALDGSAVPRSCARGRLSSELRREFTVFSPEQATVNRMLAQDIIAKTTAEAKVGLDTPALKVLEKVEAKLSSRMEEAVQNRLSESAVVRYLRVSATRDAADLAVVPELSLCLGRPLVMEVTGILVINKSSHREVLGSADVKQAIGLALSGDPGGTPIEAALKATLEARLSSAFEEVVRERTSLIVTESEPVFYPYYVRVDAAPTTGP